ncbi:hypothetical protein T12_17096 [Trichinella patagoniensis]|uniref:Uncharacterized protein n=1 Tax=Trichinella patagoniensis TaxID=990121 RepID=A0A0V0Z5X6_9BILA|nr:hypothetical protein T12_17096 [Trichinella patagoniensis]
MDENLLSVGSCKKGLSVWASGLSAKESSSLQSRIAETQFRASCKLLPLGTLISDDQNVNDKLFAVDVLNSSAKIPQLAVRSWPEILTAVTFAHDITARLPRRDLPKYNGEFAEFRALWDQFSYRVHQQKDLSNAAKLTYLRGCLTGKAAKVISSLSSSNADYEVALKRLREEFDCPAKVIRYQIKKLMQAQPKDVGLRLQYDFLRRTMDALNTLRKDLRKGGL